MHSEAKKILILNADKQQLSTLTRLHTRREVYCHVLKWVACQV